MKIKHKESGKVIELMDGTKYPTSAYDLVDEKAEDAAKKAEEKKTQKLAADQEKVVKENEKAAAQSNSEAKAIVDKVKEGQELAKNSR